MTQRELNDERLHAIRDTVLRMGGIASEMVRKACEVALTGNQDLSREVIDMDDQVDWIEDKTAFETVVALMRQSPVGADLRFLASTLRVIGEIEKVADDAVKLARRGAKLGGQIPADMKVILSELGETGRQMLGAALRLYDDYSEDLDREIVELEKQTDRVFFEAKQKLVETMRTDPPSAELAVRTIDCLQALEHVADRSSEITKHLRTQFRPAVAR